MTNPQPNRNRPPCATCKGKKAISIQARTKDGTCDKVVQCPACRGTGTAGYITK